MKTFLTISFSVLTVFSQKNIFRKGARQMLVKMTLSSHTVQGYDGASAKK